jgi:hypothetical protein
VPLVHFEGVACDVGGKVGGGVAVQAVAVGQLGLVVLAIRLNKRLDMSIRLLKFLLNFVHERKITSGADSSFARSSRGFLDLF